MPYLSSFLSSVRREMPSCLAVMLWLPPLVHSAATMRSRSESPSPPLVLLLVLLVLLLVLPLPPDNVLLGPPERSVDVADRRASDGDAVSTANFSVVTAMPRCEG